MKIYLRFREDILKGSFTVEAALLTPLILTVIFLIMGICMYEHASVYYTAAAIESAMLGSDEGRWNKENADEVAAVRAKERMEVMHIGISDIDMEHFCDGSGVNVLYRFSPVPFLKIKDFNVRESSKILNPVTFTRKIRAAYQTFDKK